MKPRAIKRQKERRKAMQNETSKLIAKATKVKVKRGFSRGSK